MEHQRIQRTSTWSQTQKKRESGSIEPPKTVQKKATGASQLETSGKYVSPVPSDWMQKDPTIQRIMASDPVLRDILQEYFEPSIAPQDKASNDRVQKQTAPAPPAKQSVVDTSPEPSDWVQQDPVMRRIIANNSVVRQIFQQQKQPSDAAQGNVNTDAVGQQSAQLKQDCQAGSSDTPSVTPPIQAKLTVSTPGDKYELEADAMAAKIMAMPDSAIQQQELTTPESHPTTPSVQRASQGDRTVNPELENRIQNATGGSPLPEAVQSFMEPRFGVDFSQIRVHTDSNAAAMCKEVGAKAFAVGNRVYYGAGYAPGKNELTAHELTHTVQQGAAKQLTKQIRQQPASSPSQAVKKITRDDIPERLKKIPLNSFEQPSPTKKLSAKQFTPDCISQKPNRISLKLSEILTPKESLTPKQFTKDSATANFNKVSPEISEQQIGAKKLQPQLSTPSQSSPQIQRNPIAQLESLRQLKDILTRVLGNASGVIGSIARNPVGFATNLVSALRQGFGQFVTNIRTHLQNGLVSWLTGGSLGSIRQPISLSNPQGIFNLTLQILGVGGNYIRSRAVNKFGATFVSRLEKSVSLFQQLRNNGLLGMFSQIQQQLGNLQTTVVEGIRKFLIERVIQAGVKWILGLLVLPISGVVKAAQTVYQVLDFFINQASRVAALVQAVTTAVQTVASGKTGVAAKAVEEALARAIPVLMGFLASLAGVGGNLAVQIRSLLAKVKERIDAVIDGLLERARGLLLQQQGNGQGSGNGGRTSSQTTGQSPPTNRQNSQQTRPNPAGQNNQISAPKLTPTDIRQHEQMASEAVQQLENTNGRLKDYNTTRAEKIAQARRMKPNYDRRLKSPIKFNVHFESNIAKDKADNDLDFKVVIAPNNTTKIGSVPTKKEPGLPPTDVTYTPQGNKAGSVKAEPLTRLRGNTKGERATYDDIPGWKHITEIDYGRFSNNRYGPVNWVKMHLLSEKLHGPGEPWNLVPGRKSDNASMEQGPESDAKKRIDRSEVLYYEVSVTYHTGEIVKDFPATINVKWGSMKEQGESFVRDKQLGHWTKNLEEPPLDGATALVIDLSTAGEINLKKLGLPIRLARNIAEESKSGPFKDEEDFKTRMEARYNNKGKFEREYWPLIKPLIGSGKARF